MSEEVQGNETESVSPIASLPINQLCLDFLNSEAGKQLVQKQIEDAVTRAIKEATSSYSPFMKQLEASLEKVMHVGSDLDYASFGDAVRQIVERQLARAAQDSLQGKIGDRIKELLEPPPAEMKLSTLVETFVEDLREAAKEDGGCHCGSGPLRASFVVEHPRGTSGVQGFVDIGLDDEHDKKKVAECDIQMTLFLKKNEIFRLRFGRFNDMTTLFSGPLFGFEKALFQMKVGGTKMIFDESEAEDVNLDYAPDYD